jgi:hypothetical protein
MAERRAANGLNFEALRFGIERCDPDLMLSFYAEDATLSIVNAEAQRSSSSPFELRGKAEIGKHLRVVFGQEASHHVEREVLGVDQVTFRETSEYPDGSRVWVDTVLEVRDGKIVRQVDVVARDTQPDREEDVGQDHPYSKTHPDTHPGVDALPTGDLS